VTPYDAIVLAGGRSSRMAELGPNTDKTRLQIGTRTLLDIALDAVAGAHSRIVVGPRSDATAVTALDVRWLREEPAGGGPVAALAAGLSAVTSPTVVVLAADLPFVVAGTIETLTAALTGAPATGPRQLAAVAVDDRERDQPLLAAYDTQALEAALPSDPDGARLFDVIRALDRQGGVLRVPLAGHPPAWWDCDSPQAWEQARMWS
jgi:molybdopterin-guanine dinucleotide biosynthesis protein A